MPVEFLSQERRERLGRFSDDPTAEQWAPPDEDELVEWIADGVCRCPDDCLVRPDGGAHTAWRRGGSSFGELRLR